MERSDFTGAMVARAGDGLSVESRVVMHQGILRNFPVQVCRVKDILQGKVSCAQDTLAVGSVEFVIATLNELCRAVPKPDYYPESLADQRHRDIERMTLADASTLTPPYFIKPADGWKFFDGQLISTAEDLEPITQLNKEDCAVWICSPVTFVAEYRVYALDGEILGVCPYAGPESLESEREPRVDRTVVESGVASLSDRSSALVLDYGVLDDGRTTLVEVNDAWAVGYYPGIARQDYLNLLIARWAEMMSAPAELGFPPMD